MLEAIARAKQAQSQLKEQLTPGFTRAGANEKFADPRLADAQGLEGEFNQFLNQGGDKQTLAWIDRFRNGDYGPGIDSAAQESA